MSRDQSVHCKGLETLQKVRRTRLAAGAEQQIFLALTSPVSRAGLVGTALPTALRDLFSFIREHTPA